MKRYSKRKQHPRLVTLIQEKQKEQKKDQNQIIQTYYAFHKIAGTMNPNFLREFRKKIQEEKRPKNVEIGGRIGDDPVNLKSLHTAAEVNRSGQLTNRD